MFIIVSFVFVQLNCHVLHDGGNLFYLPIADLDLLGGIIVVLLLGERLEATIVLVIGSYCAMPVEIRRGRLLS